MKNFLFTLLIVLLGSAGASYAQTAPTDSTQESSVSLEETVISANRVAQSRSAIAQPVQVLRRSHIERINAQTTADLLQQSGSVFLQKSQQGGGSPVLRGFEASRVLLVVDGVRMNNAIYRAGHLQNIITMDQGALERAELIFGPASTVYGTDALGGAICFFTKNPVLSEGGLLTKGSAFARYGSVNQEKTIHADISLAGRRLGSLSSLSYSDFGDLRMGKREGSEAFFGKREYYVERIGGRDSLVKNADPYLQKHSAYQQYDLMQKFVFQQNSNLRHSLNLQYSTSSDIPRYDRLTDPKGSGLSLAEWYYGPQKRLLAAYALSLAEAGWFNGGLHTTLSWQDIEESRHTRNFGAANRIDRTEQVNALGFIADGQRNWGRNTLHLGLDGQHNQVDSKARRYNVNTGEVSAQSTRYPDGGSQMSHLAAYATHQWHSRSERWWFSEGLRAGLSALRADFQDRTFFRLPFAVAEQQNTVASGSIGAVWLPSGSWRVSANASTGFRVPNVDDLAKVFDTQPGSVIVPNPDLKPEKTYNLDLGVAYRIADRLRWENSLWLTAFRDAIVTDAYQFEGKDSIEYDGTLSRVLANQNKQEARIWGLSTQLDADLNRQWTLYGSLTYTSGRVLPQEGGTTPLDHIPPMYARGGLRWHTQRLSAEVFAIWNGKKDIKDYLLNGEDNEQYAPPGGMPAWITWHLRFSGRLSPHLSVQAGVDNLLDVQYRSFASGINGPGRNVFVTLRTAW
ncbi:MAG TPA: TonB-dependent receptor [Saprospiraceae bacterium]|nr:TonB-dependent receptor [Saprospiraceae bacterium]HND87632.1 TonB-dependent receptor [Saprospiraceae bacterium]